MKLIMYYNITTFGRSLIKKQIALLEEEEEEGIIDLEHWWPILIFKA